MKKDINKKMEQKGKKYFKKICSSSCIKATKEHII